MMNKYIGLSDELGVSNQHYLSTNRNTEVVANDLNKAISDPQKLNEIAKNASEMIVNHQNLVNYINKI